MGSFEGWRRSPRARFPKLHIEPFEQFEGSRTFTNFIEPLLPKKRTEQPWHTYGTFGREITKYTVIYGAYTYGSGWPYVYTVFLAGKSPIIRSYTVNTYIIWHPCQGDLHVQGIVWCIFARYRMMYIVWCIFARYRMMYILWCIFARYRMMYICKGIVWCISYDRMMYICKVSYDVSYDVYLQGIVWCIFASLANSLTRLYIAPSCFTFCTMHWSWPSLKLSYNIKGVAITQLQKHSGRPCCIHWKLHHALVLAEPSYPIT